LAKSSDGKPAVLQQALPLFVAKPDTAQLAGQLAGRLAESGLFYESHQAEWVTGQRPLQMLLREPQAALNLPNSNPALSEENKAAAKTAEGDSRQLVDKNVKTALTTEMAQQSLLKKADDIPPEQAMRQLVRQQVDLLEQRPLVWQGNAWPGQPLKWELELQNEQESAAELSAEQRQWQTKLDLTLPKLGELGVVATMVQGQFSLRFNAVDEKTVALIKQHQPDLLQRFEAAGLNLVKSQVANEDP
ncbi:MAG: flagellar hook-length control protein FliK, partial [Deefgea sp.]